MKQASLNKVKAMCGKQSALMDGTPIIIVEPWMEYSCSSTVFRGRITVRNELNGELKTLWFDEIAEDFRPGKFSGINPFDAVATINDEVKAEEKMWRERF
jgi:hypothetical protein